MDSEPDSGNMVGMNPLQSHHNHLEALKGQPHEGARALPGSFYTDADWLQAEIQSLFQQDWICVGRQEEIAAAGDFFTFDLAGESLIIIRGEDGEIRALANVCRHRGTPLVADAGHVKRLVCPYHHWSYDTTGKLLFAPGIEPSAGFDPDSCRLPMLNVVQWMGFIFVSLSENPPDLEHILAPLSQRIRNYHLEDMRLRYLELDTWDTNWKLLLENFMEGYHLSPLHRKTLHKVNPTRLCQRFEAGDAYLGYTVGFTTRVDDSQVGHPALTDKERNTCVMFAVPPGLVVGIGSDYSSFICLQPDGPSRVRAKMGLYFFGDDWPRESVDEAVRLFHETMAEDKDVLVKLQKALGSRYYEPGPLAPPDMEGTCRDFHQYLARRMSRD